MFYFRINRLFIRDNKERPKWLITGPDLAELKLLSFVTTGNEDLPDLSEFLKEKDPAKKTKILTAAIKEVVNSRILTEIKNVKDNHIMTFGDTGYVLYKSKNIPQDFDWQLIVYESDKNIRDTATTVQDIINHKDFESFRETLLSILTKASNPAIAAYSAIAKYAIKVTAEVASHNKDDLIGILYTSLNRTEHYPHGERKKDRVADLTNNMHVDYSIFGFED